MSLTFLEEVPKWFGELAGALRATWYENPFQSSGVLPLVYGRYHPFGRYWLAALLWDHIGTVVPF